jgi:PKD domain
MSLRQWGPGVGAVVALVLCVASGAQAKTFGGVVPDALTGAHVHLSLAARIANVSSLGGPVLHSNRTHLIFWTPSGSALGYDPGYASAIEIFLARVAADSRKTTNAYGLTGQYTDSQGPAAYSSTYGGAVVATNPLPANGCSEPPTGPTWSACLSDVQLQAEIRRVIAADHLPTTDRDIYFLVTPNGLGSCETSGPEDCALGGSAAGSYCGYHTSNPDGTILYAVVPYNAVSGHCQSDNPRPNSSPADPTISTISHEHIETVTDPLGTAWMNSSSGAEIADICVSSYGRKLGGSGAAAWNEAIHGGHYFLQEEWSNDDGSCRQRAKPDAVSFVAWAPSSARKSVSFTAHARDPHGSIVAYHWFFGDGRQGRGSRLWHAFKRAGVYRVVLRTTDSAGNWAFSARAIRVAKARRR